MEEKQIEKAAQKIRTAAASSLKKKQKQIRQVMACQGCGQQKSCRKCYGLHICNACINTICITKKRPEVIRKIWQQFGSSESLEKSLPMPVPEEIDFDRLMDVIDTLKAIKGVLKDGERKELTPDKEKEIIKFLYKGS